MKPTPASNEAEHVLFVKKLKRLGQFKGRGTELISVYVPPAADRGSVMGQLAEEMSQSSNIKSPTTRKNVQSALRKISNFLKQINFDIPEKGIVVFAGNVSEKEGVSDLRLFTVSPLKPLRTKLYWCDSQFHLAPLQEMIQPDDVYALVAIDKKEATLALLLGKKYEILGKFSSGYSGKFRAGGQSAQRFERLREEAAQEFYKRVSEKFNAAFLPYMDRLKGILIGGPGTTKNEFAEKDMLDHRLKKKIIGILDLGYTDESGIREIIQRSEELLKETELVRERTTVNKFFEAIVKSGLGIYGQKDVEDALGIGKVALLLLSAGIEWEVFKFQCTHCAKEEELVIKEPLKFDSNSVKCKACNSPTEVTEEVDYLDWMIEKAHSTGAETKIISLDTPEGEQFYKGFGGIGAILRYK
ncbi:MAG: peptide chain release factor 1 [Candidatus Diapherotrites archaeon]|nr:peptide chain release factor 1 [Candidatus Diapherotrites archaeon]